MWNRTTHGIQTALFWQANASYNHNMDAIALDERESSSPQVYLRPMDLVGLEPTTERL